MRQAEKPEPVESLAGGIARAIALEPTEKGGINVEDRSYKGGMVVASPSRDVLAAAGQCELQSGHPYELTPQSVHVSPAKPGSSRIPLKEEVLLGPTGSGQQGLVNSNPETFCTLKKADELPSLQGLSLGSCGHVLLQRLLEAVPLRSKTLGRRNGKSLFPLPTSREVLMGVVHGLSDEEMSWMIAVGVSLNSMWGDAVFSDSVPNESQVACLKELRFQVGRFCSLDVKIEELDWQSFFRVKGVDYQGEEVKVARWCSWGNIEPALPPEIGTVPLEEVCTLGCRHYVESFDQFLKPPSEWVSSKPPRVMVDDDSWGSVCEGLVRVGICSFMEESELFHVHGSPLLNGLFGVSKDEFTSDGTEIFRLIMNLIPLNCLCMTLSGDVATLPSWGAMNPYFLQPSECLLVSSEDVKCFFYTMRLPLVWRKYLGFNKAVPESVLPEHLRGRTVYLVSNVLPMGFLNSVSLAQHVHRNLVLWSSDDSQGQNDSHLELRKDQSFSVGNSNWRVYLDNYDLLERVEHTQMTHLQENIAPGVLALRHEYERWEVPRNIKKAVSRSCKTEMQGATIDGVEGVAYPRESKLARYLCLALQLLQQRAGSQKQWQVACGGLVYFSMFRRPLLGSLNAVWKHIEAYNHGGPFMRVTPPDCRLEVLRFLGLLPLARMDFRLGMHPQVTCSDASTGGGGLCASHGTTAMGNMVAAGGLRGDFPEPHLDGGVLVIGLFDGIGALRVALDTLSLPTTGYISVEKHGPAQRVVERHFPGVEHYDDVLQVTEHTVKAWSTRYSQTCLVIMGAGPPCQGVSGLNSDRKGALRDERSCLFKEVPRIRDLIKQYFTWCPTYALMESVASMDDADRRLMSEGIGCEPIKCDAGCLTWCYRPRLYWCDWELIESNGFSFSRDESGGPQVLLLEGYQEFSDVVRTGWLKVNPDKPFPTFTTSRPQAKPGRKPAGIQQCTLSELERWTQDQHRFPPYQYCDSNSLVNKKNCLRLPDVSERELMLGFPLNYTSGCVPKSKQRGESYHDCRLTLLGNTWSVPVVACLLSQLTSRLGLTPALSPQEVLDRLRPGNSPMAQSRLFRLPLNCAQRPTTDQSPQLANCLGNLISIKGEDILLTTPSTQMVKFHRLRATVPSRCWKWRIVAGWKWSNQEEHINSLELRAILTSLRWRLEHVKHFKTRFIHLTDSLVCLHALTRGRTSSRKLRRPMSRINALILASGSQPLWGYVHTEQNPADRPSRWGQRVQSKFRNAKA